MNIIVVVQSFHYDSVVVVAAAAATVQFSPDGKGNRLVPATGFLFDGSIIVRGVGQAYRNLGMVTTSDLAHVGCMTRAIIITIATIYGRNIQDHVSRSIFSPFPQGGKVLDGNLIAGR